VELPAPDNAEKGARKMTKRTRRAHSAALKAKVALAAVKGEWRQLQERVADVFGAAGTALGWRL